MAGKVYQVAGHEVKAGERLNAKLGEVYLPDGTRVGVPFVAVNGVGDGPTLTVLGGVHGTEVVGIGAILRVLQQLDPQNLRGTFVGVTAANPFAVQVGSYITGIDFKNTSSTVMKNAPADGSITERTGAMLSLALRASDLVIDMHANPFPSLPFVLGSLAVAKTEQVRQNIKTMVDAFGVTRIYSNRNVASSLRDFCSEEGMAAITPELTSGHYLMPENTEVGMVGIMNIMKAFNMIDGAPVKQKCEVIEGDWRSGGKLRTQTGGFMFPQVRPGQRLATGTVVAKMYDVFGNLLEEIKIPFPGCMWSFTGGPGGTHALVEGEDIGYTFCDAKDWAGPGRETGGRGR
jgi:predicted deacylase